MITLDGKNYRTADDYTPSRKKAQQVRVGLSGKTISQTFSFTDYRFKVTILVYPSNDTGYGVLSDLRTAYGKDYVTFSDPLGGASIDVFMEGDLPEVFTRESIMLPHVPLTIELNLRRRQV